MNQEKRNKIKDRKQEDLALTNDSIGSVPIIKYIPQDGRLQHSKANDGLDNKVDDCVKDDNWYQNLYNFENICYYGTVHDVPADGNCGFHAVMALLRKNGIITHGLTLTAFRKDITHGLTVTAFRKAI